MYTYMDVFDDKTCAFPVELTSPDIEAHEELTGQSYDKKNKKTLCTLVGQYRLVIF